MLTDHSQLLAASSRGLGFTLPRSVADVDRAGDEVCKANGLVDGYVRPIAWRGSEMMGVSAQQNKSHVAIATWVWPSYFSPEARMKGLRIMISDGRRPAPDTAPTKAKAAGLYMICTLSKHKAESAGFDDALMFDWRGQIAEATGANIFFVKDGVIYTPTPDCFLDGITRRTVIGLAKRRGWQVVEKAIMPEELSDYTECFITGTAAEVVPVVGVDGRKIGDGTPGRLTSELLAAFHERVSNDCTKI